VIAGKERADTQVGPYYAFREVVVILWSQKALLPVTGCAYTWLPVR